MMTMPRNVTLVYKKVVDEIVPSEERRAKIIELTKELERRVSLACEEMSVEAIVRVEGSVAKDTWLGDDPDVDVFVRLPTSIPRESLGDVGLKIARKATLGMRQVERFAEHPYLEAFMDGVRVNIVPCYDAKSGEWISATDRTPFHTDYVNERLNDSLRKEVLLLKKFLKGIGVYGAEIKIGGFSGYLCELLILHYRSLDATLREFSAFNHRKVIDIEKYYANRAREIDLLFKEPLVIIDPVDKARNVASAVQPQKLYTLVGAARAFLKTPDKIFFFPPKPVAWSASELNRAIENHGSNIVLLAVGQVDAVPDVLWGQLYKTRRSLRKLLELGDFNVFRDAVWSDEKSVSVFLFELEQAVLSNVRLHLGPPLDREKESEDFLAKYASNGDVVCGPYIACGRWVVELRRGFKGVAEFLDKKLVGGGENVGVAKLISKAIGNGFEILENKRIVVLCEGNPELAVFFTEFLRDQPFWLRISPDPE